MGNGRRINGGEIAMRSTSGSTSIALVKRRYPYLPICTIPETESVLLFLDTSDRLDLKFLRIVLGEA